MTNRIVQSHRQRGKEKNLAQLVVDEEDAAVVAEFCVLPSVKAKDARAKFCRLVLFSSSSGGPGMRIHVKSESATTLTDAVGEFASKSLSWRDAAFSIVICALDSASCLSAP